MTDAKAGSGTTPHVSRVRCADGSEYDLTMLVPPHGDGRGLYWMPAMGVAARHYLSFAQALAERGYTVALHEWRGIGSSDRRASRQCVWGYRELLLDDLPSGLQRAGAHAPDVQWMLGGHSLGGQLAALCAALRPQQTAALILVASGSPFWKVFAPGWRWGLRVAYALAPATARVFGYFPGRRIGFGGRESMGVMTDWSRSGRSGRYMAEGMQVELELGLADLECPVLALRMQDDAFGPERSLRYLIHKMPHTPSETFALDAAALGCAAGHFAWMKSPQAVAALIDARTQWARAAVHHAASAAR